MLLTTCTCLLATLAADGDAGTLSVTTDSARHIVTLRSGPHHMSDARPDGDGATHDHGTELPLQRFTWPVDGWLRGVRLLVRDSAGAPLSRGLVHHVNVVNFARRQLFYPAAERTIALGRETADVRLPATVGVPMDAGMPMALIIAWHNDGTTAATGVVVELQLEYTPRNQMPRPLDVLPMYVDVVYPVGRNADFDLPAGRSSWSADFVMPLSGRIIGAGAHLHDHGEVATFSDVAKKRELVALTAVRGSDGKVTGIARALPGLWGSGIRLHTGRAYRLTGSYDNPTGRTITRGGMVHMAIMFAPDDVARWPRVDPDEAEFRRDVAHLDARGARRGVGEQHTGH